jgi:S1-C subfamily serine protease
MANKGIVVGGVIATAAIIFAVFVSFNSITDNGTSELIVTNGNHAQTVGETVGVGKSYDYSLIDIFEKSEESVVQVNVLRGESEGGMGSGFVYSEDGYVITNHHVVKDAQKVTVTFLDGEAYIGDVIGRDRDLDIAVVKVSPSNTYLQPIKIGDSSKLKVGERIAAIGNPFGLSGSMTSGIVSQIGRLLPQESGYSIPDVIQTDAAINPGNSGGPLINMKGEVVGINTAIQSATGEFSGIGFAVPSNTVKKVVPVLIE